MRTLTDIKATYSELLKTEEWRRKRSQILLRDRNRCCFCGSTSELEVHHRQYHFIRGIEDYKKPWLYKNKNLVTLCSKCHNAGHSLYKVPVFNV